MELKYGSDLVGRLQKFMASADPLVLVVLALLALGGVVLAGMRKRNLLVGFYVLAACFSGFMVPAIDAGSTLFRWMVLLLLAATALRGMASPGWPAILLALYGVLAFVLAFLGPVAWYSAQLSLLFVVLNGLVGAAVADGLRTSEGVKSLTRRFVWGATAFAIIALVSLPRLREGFRFAGASGAEAPLFVMTGGFLMPFALYNAMGGPTRRYRIYCGALTAVTAMLLILSGQRTGTVAGLIACVPLLFRLRVKYLLLGAGVAILTVGAIWVAFNLAPAQGRFVTERFTSTDLTGREFLWRQTIAACWRSPWIGGGMGSTRPAYLGVHNAYLAAWYDTGFFGLALFAGAYLAMAASTLRLVLKRKDREGADLGRLLFGLSLGLIASGMVEESMYSPSNLMAFTAVAVSAMASALRAQTAEGVRKAVPRPAMFEPLPQPLVGK